MDQHSPEAVRDLAERLREIMFVAGYRTATHLAQDSGLNASTLSEALSGSRVPSEQTLKKILETCGLNYTREWAGRQERAKDADFAAKAESRRSQAISKSRKTQHTHSGGRADRPTSEATPHPPSPQLNSLEPPLGHLPPKVRGRDIVLERLHNHLGTFPQNFIILHGMGGCGKTTLALNLAREARMREFDVFWVKASQQNIDGSMRQIARRLGADHEEIEEAWEVIGNGPDLLWQLLNTSHRPWLLVFDEADEPGVLGGRTRQPGDGTGWVRASQRGLTLVTTRIGDPEIWGNNAEFHAIDPLTPTDGADVLLDLAGQAGTRNEAEDLAARLGGLPLALRLAGSQLSRATRGAGLLRRGREKGRVRDFLSYLAALDDTGIDYLDRSNTSALNSLNAEQIHRRLIGRTWEISLDLLETQGFPEARTFMRLVSRFGPYPIPVDVLDSEVMQQHGAFPKGFDVDRLEIIIEALQTLSLLEIVEVAAEANEMQPAITVHNLVLEANRMHLASATKPVQEKIAQTAVRLLEAAAERGPEDLNNHHWWALLFPHIMWLLDTTESPPREIAEPLTRVGLQNFSYMFFACREPQRQAARSLQVISEQLDPDSALRLAARHRHAYASLSGIPQAMAFQELYKQTRVALGQSHPETLMSHHNWAQTLLEAGRLKEAEKELERVLAARRTELGPSHPYTLGTHWSLIMCLAHQRGGAKRADTEWDQLAQIIFTIEHPGSANLHVLHHLAHWLDSKDRYTEAEKCYRAIINVLDTTPTEGRHFCESMRSCLAQNLIRQGRLDESANTYAERLKLLEQTLSPTAEEVLSMRHDYADLLKDIGRENEFEELVRAVLEIRFAKPDRRWDIRIPSELHCLMHFLEVEDKEEEALAVAKQLVEVSQEVVAWSAITALRDDIVCVSKTLTHSGHYEEAEIILLSVIDGVRQKSKEALVAHRALALTQFASGSLDRSAFENKLLDIIKEFEDPSSSNEDELERTRELVAGLRGDLKKLSSSKGAEAVAPIQEFQEGDPETYSNQEPT
ncbi:NB-ARC domain-containing protein [Streptomyces sp. NPDC006173]|uniref:NB-ARC domain-containing protein n=1 Tax=Streptomyces sp. NPDC006173 TaxID=3155349 RepID=UPI00340A3950